MLQQHNRARRRLSLAIPAYPRRRCGEGRGEEEGRGLRTGLHLYSRSVVPAVDAGTCVALQRCQMLEA